MKRISLLAVLALVVGAFSGAYAQADPTVVDTVVQAFEQTRARTSLHVTAQSLTERSGGEGGFGGGQQQGQAQWDVSLAADGSWNLSGSQSTVIQMGDNQMQNTIQYIVLDGVTYINLDGAQMGQLSGQNDQTTLPHGWFELSADGTDQTAGLPLMSATGNVSAQALAGLLFPMSAESITAISALPDDTIDGQAMHVYQISLDAQAVIDSDASVLLRGSSGFGGGGFGGGQPPQGGADERSGAPAADVTPPAPPTNGQGTPPTDGERPAFDQTLDPANVAITIAVYVGQDDGFVHRIYSVIETAATSPNGGSSVSTVTSIVDFSALNQPVIISAPQVGA